MKTSSNCRPRSTGQENNHTHKAPRFRGAFPKGGRRQAIFPIEGALMNTNPQETCLLTVILPLTDPKDPIARTVSSLAAQKTPLHILLAAEAAYDGALPQRAGSHSVARFVSPKNGVHLLSDALSQVTTPYTVVMRPGDTLSHEDYFAKCLLLLEAYPQIGFTGTRVQFKNHLVREPIPYPQTLGSLPGEVVDLLKTPARIHTAFYGSVYRTQALQEAGFDTALPLEYAEKAALLVCLHHPQYGFVTDRTYRSYHPFENAPNLSAAPLHKEWYTDSLRDFLLPLSSLPHAPLHLQHGIYYYLLWKFRANQDQDDKLMLQGEDLKQFLSVCREVLTGVSDECFFCSAGWNELARPMQIILAQLKAGSFDIPLTYHPHTNPKGQADLAACFNGTLCALLSESKVYISLMEYKDGYLHLAGTYPRVFHPHCRLYAEYRGEKYELIPHEQYSLVKFFGQSAYKYFSFHVSIPMDPAHTGEVTFAAEGDGVCHHPGWVFHMPHSKLTHLLPASYWREGGLFFTMKSPARLSVTKSRFFPSLTHELKMYSEMVFKNRSSRKLGVLAAGLRMLYWITKPFYRKPLWVTFDKLYKGGDCGEYFFRYASKQKDGIKVQYILNGDSPSLPNSEKRAFNPPKPRVWPSCWGSFMRISSLPLIRIFTVSAVSGRRSNSTSGIFTSST